MGAGQAVLRPLWQQPLALAQRPDRCRFDAGGSWRLALGDQASDFAWYMPSGPSETVTRQKTRATEIYPDLKGNMDGRFLDGPFAGRGFSSLSEEEQKIAGADLAVRDPEGHRLFQAYLYGRATGWRDTVKDDPRARQSGQGGSSAMTEQEAYEVLGLQMGAGEEEIRQAHRALMKKLHPDQGGSTYLATRVNMAKDVLLSAHR